MLLVDKTIDHDKPSYYNKRTVISYILISAWFIVVLFVYVPGFGFQNMSL